VDDNHDACELLADLLRAEGHHVQIAHDGPSALKVAAQHKPNVALLDIGLPGMNGYELAEELRRIEGLEDIELIATTGYGQPDDRLQSNKARFAAHLVKPIDLDSIEAVLGGTAPGDRDCRR
jgi:CheY-like chemotaxis protein